MGFSSWSNVSNISSTTSVPPRRTYVVVVESFILFILNIAALVGNLLVCMAFYRNPSLRTVTTIFIFSLALADLLMAVTVIPVFTFSSLLNTWIAGEILSQVIFCCLVTAAITSILTVMLVAVNRYFRLVRPQLYGNYYSKKTSASTSVAAWVVSLFAVVGSFVLGLRVEDSENNPSIFHFKHLNRTSLIFTTVTRSLLVWIPSLVVLICYVKVYQTIRHYNAAVDPSSQEGNSSYGVEEARITKLLTIIVATFYLCWLPAIITGILMHFKLLPSSILEFIGFMRQLPVFTSSVINPIVYGVTSRSFRSEFVKIVRCR